MLRSLQVAIILPAQFVQSLSFSPWMILAPWLKIIWPYMHVYFWAFFFFLAVLGSELWVLHLLGRCSTTWATPSAFFALVNFWPGTTILLPMATCIAGPQAHNTTAWLTEMRSR
jgi:hypothetical protein